MSSGAPDGGLAGFDYEVIHGGAPGPQSGETRTTPWSRFETAGGRSGLRSSERPNNAETREEEGEHQQQQQVPGSPRGNLRGAGSPPGASSIPTTESKYEDKDAKEI